MSAEGWDSRTGLGGLSAAIAIARAGAEVTLLEAAHELGEIGAGIQLYPNVSRFLIRWGVDKIIGDNLVLHDEVNTYAGPEATLIACSSASDLALRSGFPWWVARRDHLHHGLTESARAHGVNVIVNSRVSKLKESAESVEVSTTNGNTYIFDFLVGADGIRSFIRSQIAPGVGPKATSKVAAYRGVLTYEQIFSEIPEARAYLRNSMDSWVGPNGCILTYPISGGKELNIVTAFCKDDYVTEMGQVDIEEFRNYYQDYSPVIQKILRLVNYTQRWPLLQMPPMKSWSNQQKNIVLLGDAAHGMQNFMGQGAATAIEDGAFLGRIMSEIVRGTLSIPEAISIYEKQRIPKSWVKQQVSYVSGLVSMTTQPRERDLASVPEVVAAHQNRLHQTKLPPTYRSWQYFCSSDAVPGVYFYDAEGDADAAVCEYLTSRGEVNETEMLSENLRKKWLGHATNNGMDYWASK
ncbi:FAD/NAD(P)-binding domain-containing protein [Periconia macrospinosa]|uniref:FAD/NAD(P)-binding domain-containing protein n=1 Tax=Periconia macrospinosa TaxID=97972 RepID=A0A2V1DJW8_9PLEO|nr:FAD/NAD(P)-binding domain-containing protein [Periconia macrospinosa]